MFFATLLLATASVTTTTVLPTMPIVIEQRVEEPKAELNSTSTVRSYIEEEAIKKGVDPKLATSISDCESGFVPQQSKHLTKTGEREDSWGVWQINLPHHPNVTREQAMDVRFSTEYSLELIKKGKAHLWSCNPK
jgi:hypothetical protein